MAATTAVLVALVIGQILLSGYDLNPTAPLYLNQAHGLITSGNIPDPRSGGSDAPGRYTAPLYPIVIAAIAAVDDSFAKELQCIALNRENCNPVFPLWQLFALQALAVVATLLVFLSLAEHLSSSRIVALTALFLAYIAGRFVEVGMLVEPATFANLFFTLGCLQLVRAQKNNGLVAPLSGGALFATASLFEIGYFQASFMACLIGAAVLSAGRRQFVPSWAGGILLCVGFAIVIAPWSFRNFHFFGDPLLVAGVDIVRLSERVAFNNMTTRDIAVALVSWTPAFGDGVAGALVDQADLRRISTYAKGSFLEAGRSIYDAMGGRPPREQAQQLWAGYIIGEPLRFLASSVPLVYRGLWPSGSVFLIWGACLLPVLVLRMRAIGQGLPLLLGFAPMALLPLTQGLTSANHGWTNLLFVFPLCYAVARVSGGAEIPPWKRS